MANKVLIVDDRLDSLLKCADLFTERGYDVTTCRRSTEALGTFTLVRPDVVLLDIKMPGKNGFELLKEIRARDRRVCVVMLSAYGDAETVVSAMKLGADNFAEKGLDPEKLLIVVEKELGRKQMEMELALLRGESGLGQVGIDHLIGESKPMRLVKQSILQYADTDLAVLLTGQSGTGKDLVAGVLHHESSRGSKTFQHLLCPGLAEGLFESEIFGHERGSFTGAHKRRKGIIEAAGSGTVFLNEFVDIPPDIQAKLLLVIDTGVYMRIGGEGKTMTTKARFIAATNKDVQGALRSGRLREDFYFRLNQAPIELPPLKERGQDILLLADHFIKVWSRKLGKPEIELSEASRDLLLHYHWPGNVRELETIMKRVVMTGSESVISGDTYLTRSDGDRSSGGPHRLKDITRSTTEAVEKEKISEALTMFGGNRKKAAEWLAISYRSLLGKMQKYDLRRRF